MKEIYRKFNERTVNKMARKIMNHPKSTYQKSVRNGVLAQGGDIKYLEDVIKNEIAFINYSTFEEVSQYNPRKFIKSMKTNNWVSDGLKILPQSMFEHAYIGTYLFNYTGEKDNFDLNNFRGKLEKQEYDCRDEQLNLCKQFIKRDHEEQPNLIQENELQPYFENSKVVYICHITKAILVIYEFKDFLYSLENAELRPDSWHYNSKYYIRNEEVLMRQLNKIKNIEEELEVPNKNQVKDFIFWLNGPVTYKKIVEYIQLIGSINVKSSENMRYSSEKIRNSDFNEKYKDYMLYGVFSTIDPYSPSVHNRCVKYEKISHDYLNDEKYKEIYE